MYTFFTCWTYSCTFLPIKVTCPSWKHTFILVLESKSLILNKLLSPLHLALAQLLLSRWHSAELTLRNAMYYGRMVHWNSPGFGNSHNWLLFRNPFESMEGKFERCKVIHRRFLDKPEYGSLHRQMFTTRGISNTCQVERARSAGLSQSCQAADGSDNN